jgi:hypothetical protein
MLFDLAHRSPDRPLRADVCIVGSGPVGLTLARALAEKGVHVVMLEEGPEVPEIRERPAGLRFDRREYRGADLGRAFGYGGTSSSWGGQLLPIRAAEMRARSGDGAPAWPLRFEEIDERFAQIERWAGVEALPFDLRYAESIRHPLATLDWEGLAPRFSKWIPFRGRNLGAAWRPALVATGMVQCWINAGARQWESGSASRRIERVAALSPNGHRLSVEAGFVVFAAGALESARLVSEMAEETGIIDPRSTPLLGRFLHDHLSLRMARVDVLDQRRFMELFSPTFSGHTMRSLRFELDPQLAQREGLPPFYAHFVAEAPEDSGFAALRDLLRDFQQRRPRTILRGALRLPGALPDVAEMAWWRLARGRLAFPRGPGLYLYLDVEQAPRRNNRVYGGERDGPRSRRICHIDWEPDLDPGPIAEVAGAHIARFWRRNNLQRTARLEFFGAARLREQWPTNLYQIYHPAGTTRMAGTADMGVVDADAKIYGTGNAYVAGSSVFPSMGAANPTFSAMALALRLADRLAQECGAGGGPTDREVPDPPAASHRPGAPAQGRSST